MKSKILSDGLMLARNEITSAAKSVKSGEVVDVKVEDVAKSEEVEDAVKSE